MSSRIMYKLGTSSSVIMVAKTIPNASEMAMGIRKRAWRLFSKSIGARPRKVVRVVSMIGLNLRVTESLIT